MKTVALRIGNITRDRGSPSYPVELLIDDGSPEWWKHACARGHIPTSSEVVGSSAMLQLTGPETLASNLLLDEHQSSDAFTEVGNWLYQLLARGDVKERWEELQDLHPGENSPGGDGLRLILDIRPPTLRGLPWELMRRDERALFVQPASPCFRGTLPLVTKDPPDLPLRVLVAVGSASAEVLAEDELTGLLGAVGKFRGTVDCDVLHSPSRDQFFSTYERWRPHVFHFIGHARILTRIPVLEFKGWDLSRPDILNLLNWPGRLAVLNACRTTGGDNSAVHQTGTGQLRASLSLAAAFLNQGFLAVVAMQGDIASNRAADFAGSLYGTLAEGLPVDEAVAYARQAIFRVQGEADRRNWALPSLVLAASPDTVLPPPKVIRARVAQVTSVSDFDVLKAFVDRTTERHELWMGLDPDGFDLDSRHVRIVRGEFEIGKTWLLLHCLRTWMVRDRMVRWVRLVREDHRGLDLLAAQRAMRRGTQTVGLKAPLDAESPGSFDDFDAHVAELVKDGSARDEDGLLKLEAPSDRAIPEHLGEGLVERFAECLRRATEHKPLYIALDDISGVEASAFRELCNRLFVRFGPHDLKGVRSVIAVTPDVLKSHVPHAFQSDPLFIGDMAAEHFKLLAREFFTHNRDRVASVEPGHLIDVIDFFARSIHAKGGWKPRTLEAILTAVILTAVPEGR